MKKPVKRVLFWGPRILSIIFAIFLSLFALDVFLEGYDVLDTLIALFIHLIPAFIVLIVLALSWRREWIGGVGYLILGALYMILFWDPSRWVAYLMISGPLFLIGILFFMNWINRRGLQTVS
jgi:hypothetical protein